jgi:serine/threonine protein kinase
VDTTYNSVEQAIEGSRFTTARPISSGFGTGFSGAGGYKAGRKGGSERIMTISDVLISPAKTLFGYDIIEPLGEGAGSVIYAVSDPSTKQIYALKYVRRKTEKDIRFVEQLEAEHEISRQVSHPGLRKTIDMKYERTMLRKVTSAGLVMELFDGRPLEHELPNDLADLVTVFIRTGEALESLHNLGYIHCDLKPNNIMVGQDLGVKVIDLGQGCKVGTVKERIQGTPDYIAPEQVKCEPLTFRTDVFNFGATMYWALTGQKLPTLYTLKKGENSFLLDNTLKSPHDLNEAVPENLSNLVMECVKTNSLKRPADFKEVVPRLEVMHHALTRGRR